MWEPQSVKFNLIKNPCALETFEHWTIDENGGDCWKIEDMPGDAGEHFPKPTVSKYFVTSYGRCLKSELIDLKEMNYSDEVMDVHQPPIVVTDWYAGRSDCSSEYNLVVRLLSEEKKVIQQFCSHNKVVAEDNGTRWQHITHTFSNYGPGVRYIYFQHGGKSSKMWKGWYGVRVTNSSISIEI